MCYLAGEGMSERAIAQAAGVSKSTVHRDLTGGPDGPRETFSIRVAQPEGPSLRDAIATGPRSASTPVALQHNDDQQDENDAVDLDAGKYAGTTGLDGKTYPKRKPQPPRRKPITRAFFDAMYDFRKLTNRVERLAADERFARNRNELARYAPDLQRHERTIATVIQQLQVDQIELTPERDADIFRDAVKDVERSTQRLLRLAREDRFPAIREAMSALGFALQANDADLCEVIERLTWNFEVRGDNGMSISEENLHAGSAPN